MRPALRGLCCALIFLLSIGGALVLWHSNPQSPDDGAAAGGAAGGGTAVGGSRPGPQGTSRPAECRAAQSCPSDARPRPSDAVSQTAAPQPAPLHRAAQPDSGIGFPNRSHTASAASVGSVTERPRLHTASAVSTVHATDQASPGPAPLASMPRAVPLASPHQRGNGAASGADAGAGADASPGARSERNATAPRGRAKGDRVRDRACWEAYHHCTHSGTPVPQQVCHGLRATWRERGTPSPKGER